MPWTRTGNLRGPAGPTGPTGSGYPPFAAGNNYGPYGGQDIYTMVHGQLDFVGLGVPLASVPIKSLAMELTALGATGRTIRLGLWLDSGTGAPGALVAQGLIAAYGGTIGGRVTTLATPANVEGNFVWLGAAAQVQSGYASTVRAPDVRGITAYVAGVRTLMSGTSASSLRAVSLYAGAFTSNPAVAPSLDPGPRVTVNT